MPNLKEGVLQKQAGGVSALANSWHERYFVLSDAHILSYFEDKEDADDEELDGTAIPLSGSTIQIVENNRMEINCHDGTKFRIECKSPEELNSWVSALEASIAAVSWNAKFGSDAEGWIKIGESLKPKVTRYAILKTSNFYLYLFEDEDDTADDQRVKEYRMENSVITMEYAKLTLSWNPSSKLNVSIKFEDVASCWKWASALKDLAGPENCKGFPEPYAITSHKLKPGTVAAAKPVKLQGKEALAAEAKKRVHQWKPKTLTSPTWCTRCSEFIWGAVLQARSCNGCGLIVHHRCAEDVPNDCARSLNQTEAEAESAAKLEELNNSKHEMYHQNSTKFLKKSEIQGLAPYLLDMDLEKHSNHSQAALLDVLVSITTTNDLAQLGSVVLPIFDRVDRSAEMISRLICAEVEQTTQSGTLFRTNSAATKIMTEYAVLIGKEYMRKVIGTYLESTAYLKELALKAPGANGEIDAATATALTSLEFACDTFLNCVIGCVDFLPPTLRVICECLRTSVRQRFPAEGSSVEYIALNGFLFLRFLCPALVAPDHYGLVKDTELSMVARKNNLLVSKVIQTVANGVRFGDKETKMLVMNSWIDRNADEIRAFGDAIVTDILQSPMAIPISRVKALGEYSDPSGGQQNILGLVVGERLDIIRPSVGDGWTLVRNMQGLKGYVPTCYLDREHPEVFPKNKGPKNWYTREEAEEAKLQLRKFMLFRWKELGRTIEGRPQNDEQENQSFDDLMSFM